ncbi:apolipoprotein N-acyltransferase [Stackebrandtia endophytica]|uniref:Apolipoprotein N-acyltransferase n=1 Tax=Stackebrandtia endophytica TaxID=1496996 RepID=A0A543B477_9ACTN|nr:apolipoprotein N-acyltransferase [Stackebrandtia endophytica]TQL79631.1 apolipoprotein N-acyltransferase [Stackebrandtia endophytica]
MTAVVDAPDKPSPKDDPPAPRSLTTRVGPDGRRLRLPVALAVAAASGVLLLLAFPPFDLWFLAPVGVAGLTAACHRRKIRGGLGLGFVAGLTFFVPLLSWTSTQVGSVPWAALSLLESLYFALLGGAIAYTSRLIDRRPLLWATVTALLWVGQEALRGRTPFGGFPWGRLAFSQADSPLANFAWLAGAPMVTFATAFIGGVLVVLTWRTRRQLAATVKQTGAWAGAIAAVLLLGLVMPIGLTSPGGETVTVAVVQGSVPRLGLDFNAQRRAVLDNHVDATIDLANAVAAGEQKQPDIVVWPENSSDIDPIANQDAADRITEAAQAIGVPIVLGTLQRLPDGQSLNLSLVWDPETGPGFEYVKQHPVPFAEYIPIESFVRTVGGWLDPRIVEGIDRVNGFQPGTEPGIIPVGDLVISGVICFEVAYDDLVRESVVEGAQLVAVQTNNATFNNAEATQQMAMVRLRSIEHGRAGLMASTVGVSGFTDASGAVHDLTTFDTQAVIVSDLTLGDGTTPATTLGALPELLACAAAVLVLLASGINRRRAGSRPLETANG